MTFSHLNPLKKSSIANSQFLSHRNPGIKQYQGSKEASPGSLRNENRDLKVQRLKTL
jgi:hypothetical protein